MTADAVRRAGPAAEGLVFPESAFDPQSPANPPAGSSPRTRPVPGGAGQLRGARLRCVEARRAGDGEGGGADPESVRRGLNSIDDYAGASGPVAFDENGDVVQYPRLFIVHHGRAEPYDRFVEGGGALPGAPPD